MDKKLKLGSNRKLLGVCSGFADYFEIDVTLIRIIWIILFLGFGFGLLAYFICWAIMPKR